MDYHVVTREAVELVMQVIDGKLIIVPPAAYALAPAGALAAGTGPVPQPLPARR